MTIEEYVEHLEQQVKMTDSHFVYSIKDWSPSDKLYVYLHKIQLGYMERFSNELDSFRRQLVWFRAQTSQ